MNFCPFFLRFLVKKVVTRAVEAYLVIKRWLLADDTAEQNNQSIEEKLWYVIKSRLLAPEISVVH